MKYVQGSILTEKAGKLFKKADRIFCSVKDDRIYITNGYILFNISSPEYDAFFRPVIGYDPGNWIIQNGEKMEDKGRLDRFIELLKRDSFPAQKAPFMIQSGKNTLAALYGEEKDCIAFVNAAFLEAFTDSACALMIGEKEGLYIVNPDQDLQRVALLLPVRVDDGGRYKKAVKAYFEIEEKPDEKEAKAARKIARLEEELYERYRQVDELTAKLNAKETAEKEEAKEKDQMIEELKEKLKEAAQKEEAQKEEAPKKKSPADIAAALMKYGKVTIKGENTEKPIVWIVSGKENKEALKAAGAKWSMKKSAWYVCA